MSTCSFIIAILLLSAVIGWREMQVYILYNYILMLYCEFLLELGKIGKIRTMHVKPPPPI